MPQLEINLVLPAEIAGLAATEVVCRGEVVRTIGTPGSGVSPGPGSEDPAIPFPSTDRTWHKPKKSRWQVATSCRQQRPGRGCPRHLLLSGTRPQPGPTLLHAAIQVYSGSGACMSLVVKLEDDLGERSEWIMLHGIVSSERGTSLSLTQRY